jgi:hypothetical protein
MTDEQVKKITEWVFLEFKDAGVEDKTAKQSTFTDRLKRNWTVSATAPAVTMPTSQGEVVRGLSHARAF